MQLSELVRRIRSGEKEAVKELVAAYGSAVFQRALERTGDRELAREAARQTFGQFVAIVQQQPEDDGWMLWFGDLIERNISTYAQISTDMRTIENELDHEITDSDACMNPAPSRLAEEEPEPYIWRPEQPEPARKAEEPPVWREEETPQPQRAQEKPQRGNRGKKVKERGKKPSERASRDSIRDEIFDDQYRNRDKSGSGHALSVVLLILVSLLLIWIVAGVAMTMQWVPYYDLGYSWFNTNVFKLF